VPNFDHSGSTGHGQARCYRWSPWSTPALELQIGAIAGGRGSFWRRCYVAGAQCLGKDTILARV
jgi:hypothetical protein